LAAGSFTGIATIRSVHGAQNQSRRLLVEHGEDLIGQFPREHDAVNFATMRNDGVKQWEKNVRTFPALTVVSRETTPPRPGFNSTTDRREIGKGLGFEAGARSERRFNSP